MPDPQKPFTLADFGITEAKPQSTQRKSVVEMGRERVTSDAPDTGPTLVERMTEFGQGMAHPQTLGDVLSLALPVKGIPAGAEGAAAAVGPRVESIGSKVLKTGESPAFKKFAGRVGLVELLRATMNPKELALAVGAMAAPAMTRGAGRKMIAAGKVLSRSGATPAVAEEAAQAVVKAAPEVVEAATTFTIADDLKLIRDMGEKEVPATSVIKIISQGDADYADKLTKAWKEAVKINGLPVPESVKALMKSPSFAKLPQ